MKAQRGFLTLIEILLVLAIIVILAAMFFDAGKEDEREAAFMKACVMERPQYECTAMWRAGRRDSYFFFFGGR